MIAEVRVQTEEAIGGALAEQSARCRRYE